jgi:anti-sigma regulatory factor (Ser/Thr protein kinase)
MSLAVEHELPKNGDAPGLARDFIRSLDGQVPQDLVADANLLVSELVTNGVKYGGEGRIVLQIEAGPDRMRAEIVDQGSGFEHQTRATRKLTPGDEGGWGLELVETLADEWGVHEGSTHVWFEIRR